ncbi:MAG: cupin domain-containing protein [Anaerolineae bacterium CG_4_9_14_3_um_filter_57_17]|nr:cupin domain-containing protein [bacterium]NCT20852.1 cupin domain-containing protein [bacterium]OIO84435.1 MAG: cupin [Anaerolineae bacterium CG2_30_57_67]PJB65223.1 MAG: cupin domain-containing protein [Anaerolineae bacterium CG_4_9_14_3_um_filter_57_17]
MTQSPILNFVTLIAYQEGSVVSRQVIKAEAGNVTLFAFDAGQGLSEHTAPFDALAHILEGRAEIFIAGELHELQAGQAILLPANLPHALKAPEAFKMLLTMIRA